ncbi:MAG TPA: DUF4235 domain-containing protein [Micromonosporaceae bacterium]|nr:DUF4235 domain-containing protein [Micromonosporaceae bacterium]
MGFAGKIASKPIGMVAGAIAGLAAGYIFKKTWLAIAGDERAPEAGDESSGWTEVLVAAALQGAIFAIVRAAVDRAQAQGFRRLTGHH